MAESRLFKPLRIGNVELKHRIAMAPLTRLRSDKNRVPVSLMKEYYSQRASIPGTLIISEGTFVSHAGSGSWAGAPGIWREDQINAWKEITDEVHRKGSFIYCQLFANGRAAIVDMAEKEGVTIVGPSALRINESFAVPRVMTIDDIKESIQEFVIASRNAIRAGFDGVELHGANGFLADQFIQDVSNTRTDEYGGSIENRSRYIDELMKAVVSAIGAERVGLRLSPWSLYNGMGMADPIPQFSDVVTKANGLHLAYVHFIESRVAGSDDQARSETLDFAFKLLDIPILVAGGYKFVEAQKHLDQYPDKDIVVVFGRLFVSNPDLVYRIKQNLKVNAYDRDSFYTNSAIGYIDYPFSPEFLAAGTA